MNPTTDLRHAPHGDRIVMAIAHELGTLAALAGLVCAIGLWVGVYAGAI